MSDENNWKLVFSESMNNFEFKRDVWQRSVNGALIVEIIHIKSYKEEKCICEFYEPNIYEFVSFFPDLDIFEGYNVRDNIVYETIQLVKIVIDMFLKGLGFEIDRI